MSNVPPAYPNTGMPIVQGACDGDWTPDGLTVTSWQILGSWQLSAQVVCVTWDGKRHRHVYRLSTQAPPSDAAADVVWALGQGLIEAYEEVQAA